MQKNSNTPLISAILVAAVLVGGALIYLGSQIGGGTNTGDINVAIEQGIEDYIQKQQEGAGSANRTASTVDNDIEDDDASIGESGAPITMIEFSDYECPFCKRNFTQNLPGLIEKYIDTGKLRLVYRDFPLSFHDPLATQQAMAAECVREQSNDKTYFDYHDLVFQATESNGKGMEKSALYDLAEQVGVDRAKFTSCLDSEKFKKEVADDINDGQKAGITGTPGFLILTEKDDSKAEDLKALEVVQQGQYINQYIETDDGKIMGMRVSGAQPLDTFEGIFELLLTQN